MEKSAIVIHGGAGGVSPDIYSDSEKKGYELALKSIIDQGFQGLAHGQSALDVVSEAVSALEDDPLFNAGRGSVFDANGEMSFDASLMCGQSMKVGGVTSLKKIKNPIFAARWVLKNSTHSLIAGSYLEDFLEGQGFTVAQPSFFKTDKRYEQYLEAQKTQKISLDHGNSNTVGAVARDIHGNLAAATSTGGMTYKFPGRVSDSSIIGAGTYANNATCAVSGTGTGDIFIQHNLCHLVHCLMSLKGLQLTEACNQSLDLLQAAQGFGGLIAIDYKGDICMPFRAAGMFRAYRDTLGGFEVAIF
ncbi:MAG: isoaspartyl peptidase/L-asparaginase [Bdellovibrionales bacterium]|nr:isoaspartyl peptidase/L-asparaginase [Bdellovibrionales bacterium]